MAEDGIWLDEWRARRRAEGPPRWWIALMGLVVGPEVAVAVLDGVDGRWVNSGVSAAAAISFTFVAATGVIERRRKAKARTLPAPQAVVSDHS